MLLLASLLFATPLQGVVGFWKLSAEAKTNQANQVRNADKWRYVTDRRD